MSYTEEHARAYPPEYLAGIELYNAGEFHAAHDAWEDRWRDDCGPREKLFLQALIQSAVVFHHIEIGRRGAARRMYGMALEKFERLGAARFMSLDVSDYLAQLARSLSWLRDAEDPRDAAQPADFTPPHISLLPEVTDYD
jgi:predicted metal-dependent hydrolase